MNRPIEALRRLRAAFLLATLPLVVAVGPAEAHRLKVFATVEDGDIFGHAFFVGGGRPEGAELTIADANGVEAFHGRTDPQGGFRWRPLVALDYTITVDTGDGHRVVGTVAADRLASVASPPSPAVSVAGKVPPPDIPAATPVATSTAPAADPGAACLSPIDPAALAKIAESRVDQAVARQLRPLIEAYDQAEGRVRINDVLGGIGMIVGLFGTAAWATARRRPSEVRDV
ncbi:MAG: cobalamin biosynthesis protein CbiM [Siculibacillus sp.]|nr:cobalamin biosynthesis protein CbiM [Siculibacillus sp.]